MKLYLDDEREAPPGWTQCRWPNEVIALMNACDVFEISLDHDLGDDERGTGYHVLSWIESMVVLHDFKPPIIHIHTANTSARIRMEAARSAIYRHYIGDKQ